MRLEGLVTCREIIQSRDGEFTLVGVFQDLPRPPSAFAIYLDLRPGAEDSAVIKVRVRTAGRPRAIVFESAEELVVSPLVAGYAIGLPVEEVALPSARLVVEVLIDGSVAGSRVINLGHD